MSSRKFCGFKYAGQILLILISSLLLNDGYHGFTISARQERTGKKRKSQVFDPSNKDFPNTAKRNKFLVNQLMSGAIYLSNIFCLSALKRVLDSNPSDESTSLVFTNSYKSLHVSKSFLL